MPLSDDERRRIEEEERLRAEVRIRAEADAKQKAEGEAAAKAAAEKKKAGDKAKKGCFGCLGVFVFLWILGSLLPHTPPPSGSGTSSGQAAVQNHGASNAPVRFATAFEKAVEAARRFDLTHPMDSLSATDKQILQRQVATPSILVVLKPLAVDEETIFSRLNGDLQDRVAKCSTVDLDASISDITQKMETRVKEGTANATSDTHRRDFQEFKSAVIAVLDAVRSWAQSNPTKPAPDLLAYDPPWKRELRSLSDVSGMTDGFESYKAIIALVQGVNARIRAKAMLEAYEKSAASIRAGYAKATLFVPLDDGSIVPYSQDGANPSAYLSDEYKQTFEGLSKIVDKYAYDALRQEMQEEMNRSVASLGTKIAEAVTADVGAAGDPDKCAALACGTHLESLSAESVWMQIADLLRRRESSIHDSDAQQRLSDLDSTSLCQPISADLAEKVEVERKLLKQASLWSYSRAVDLYNQGDLPRALKQLNCTLWLPQEMSEERSKLLKLCSPEVVDKPASDGETWYERGAKSGTLFGMLDRGAGPRPAEKNIEATAWKFARLIECKPQDREEWVRGYLFGYDYGWEHAYDVKK